MKTVLSVASEVAPLIKTGGLADVAGALPNALHGEGWRMVTLLPGYPGVMSQLRSAQKIHSEADLFGGAATVLEARVASLDLLILDAPHLYDRTGAIYTGPDGADWPDNPERFAALSWVAAQLAAEGIGGQDVDVLHVHDWQAALAPLYLREMAGAARPGTLLTIHNIAFHGLAKKEKLRALRLPKALFDRDGLEFWDQINMLKGGLISADKINTVSPTYARELLTPEFGMGLDGVLQARKSDLSGILNGIDAEVWNPATDPAIHTYKTPRGKTRAKAALLQEFGLEAGQGPLCVVISRLTGQKGLDLLLDCLHVIEERDARLILLGSGDRTLEAAWGDAAASDSVAVRIGYDEELSHRMIAGADAILVPSRFEPCGLTQLYGLRYGTLPLVADTGGLSDTVIDSNVAARAMGVATGVKVNPVSADALRAALGQLCDLWDDPAAYRQMQKNAMAQPVGWEASARRYAALYDSIRGRD